MPHIFVVDDEQDLCEILRFDFENEGFGVRTANSAEEALEVLEKEPSKYDLLLLDVMMERMSGYELAKRLRDEGNNVPIIFLTALSGEPDQLRGFNAGGDDYICKPFSFSTVLARVKAVLKRSMPQYETHSLCVDGLCVDLDNALVTLNGSVVSLTKKEYLILTLLVKNRGRIFSRDEIMRNVWDEDICVGDRSVDVHIARLRKKIGNLGTRIANRTGFGYVFQ